MKLMKKSQYLQSPWKNGKGTTSQIEIFPAEADFTTSHFLWRLSSARITESGAFSIFPEHSRLLSVISGGALELKIQGSKKSSHLLKAFTIFEFEGIEEVHCELQGDAAVDLGLIFNPKWVIASMRIERLEKSNSKLKLEDGIHFIVCVAESLKIGNYELCVLDSLRLEGCHELQLQSSNQNTRIAIVHIQNRTLSE